MAVQFWQVLVNVVNKHAKTDRFAQTTGPNVAMK
jgi:hypothetical protein